MCHSNRIRGTIKTFSALVFWEWPRAENVPSFLDIISLCLDVLSPTLFEFAYPFKMDAFFLVPQILTNSLFNAFIASKIPSVEVSFQIWKQIEVGRG